MKREKSAGKLLQKYIQWTVLAAVLFVVFAAVIYFAGPYRAGAAVACALLGVLIMAILYFSFNNSITRALTDFALSTEAEHAKLARELDVPYVILEENGKIIWKNQRFTDVFASEGKSMIADILPELDPATLTKSRKQIVCIYRDRKYRVELRPTKIDDVPKLAVFFYDETELRNLIKKFDDNIAVVGLIYLDNYEEAMESVEEVKRSLLIALVDRKVSKYIGDLDGVVKKLEKDKYLFFLKKMYLEQIETTRFDLLEEVKTVNIGNEMSITASIGVGLGSDTLSGNYEFARKAIDMALARGGDQAVVKDEESVRYFGGKSQSVEKSTRVKARVKAQAFKEIIDSCDRLLIMGHKMMDIDCLGSAVGIWRMANTFGKKAHILISEVSSSIRPTMERFRSGDYPEDMFISNAQAMDLVTEETVLVVVDVNRPSFTGAPELLDIVQDVVVFDHHRQGTENIGHAILSYIEPYASSTCEMVSEIVQYISDKVRLKAPEADAMYAGIMIDTYNFTNQTGVRTFEAAAFLRKSGADVTRVRKLFRDDYTDYRAKADAIHGAEIYRDAFAITECKSDGLESPTIVGAQAANELLDISGVKASLVFTEYEGKVFISARSIDEVNVQVMMERLGGGGHRSIAGAQLTGVSVEDAMKTAKAVIDDMITKGEMEA